MLSHLFKLIWNKKKQNFLLITEMFVSFLVMFSVFTLLVHYYNNYRQPHGFDYERVWAVNYNDDTKPATPDSVMMYMQSIRQSLSSLEGIEAVSFSSGNIPFSYNTFNNDVEYKQKRTMTNIYDTEDNYASLFNVKLTEGRWFNKADIAGKTRPVVINEKLKRYLFGNESAVGKIIGREDNQQKVIGVIADMKFDGDYQEAGKALYARMDTNNLQSNNTILLKVKPGTNAAFEAKLYKVLNNLIKDANIEIEHLAVKRDRKNSLSLVPMIILLVVGGFLIINVALGLFGVLWYNISKRRGEIGLRRAIGASSSSISYQLVGEAIVLATFALILGTFFAVQFPLLQVFDLPAGVYITALLLAVAFIYVLVIACALYPGRQAAAIYPAIALHEE